MRATIKIPGPKTGYQHSQCYAGVDGNCSKQLSREHFISQSLLRQIELNDSIKIAGLKWQMSETFNIIPINGLASKVLCERHNNALSSLDDKMGQFSLTIREFDNALRTDARGPFCDERTFWGSTVERWMLKCLFGMIASGNVKDCRVKPECLDYLYDRAEWPDGWGLYFGTPLNTNVYHSDSLAVEIFLHPTTQVVLIAKFTVRGLPLILCLGRPDQPRSFGVFRPGAFVFRASGRERQLILEWENGAGTEAIFLDRKGSYDGPPPDWSEWERKG